MKLRLNLVRRVAAEEESVGKPSPRSRQLLPYREILEQCSAILAAFNPSRQTLQGLCEDVLE